MGFLATHMSVYMCLVPKEPKRDLELQTAVRCPGTGVVSSCDSLNMGAGI